MYDYAAGKVDWMAAGRPTEGTLAAQPRAGQRARRDVPRSRLEERAGEASARALAAGWQMSVVVNDHDIVLGVLEGLRLDAGAETTVAEAMRPGPSTHRAHEPAAEVAAKLAKGGRHRAIVTTPEGELIGVAFLDDLLATEVRAPEK